MKKRISVFSIISLVISVISVTFWALLFEGMAFAYFPWLITGVISMLFPILAKYLRKKHNRGGLAFEVIALVLGWFSFWYVLPVTIKVTNTFVVFLICSAICFLYAKLFSKQTLPQEKNDELSSDETEQIENAQEIENEACFTSKKEKNLHKQRFCKFCGNIIDNETKKCTGCGKTCHSTILIVVFSIIIVFVIVIGLFLILDSSKRTTATTNSNTNSPVTEHLHSYSDATCTKPKTCLICGDTQGTALGHSIVDDMCTKCGTEKITIELQGTWKSTFGPNDANYRIITFSGNSHYYEYYYESTEEGCKILDKSTGTFVVEGNVLILHETGTETRITETGSQTNSYEHTVEFQITKCTSNSLYIDAWLPLYKQ